MESDLSNEAQGAPADGPAAQDPLYAEQWHLANTGQGGAKAGEDLRAEGAWR